MSHGRPWTADDAQRLRRLVAAGMTDAQIGEVMERHPEFIGCKRRAKKLQPGQSAVFTAMMARVNARRRMARA